jgi:hypothetical protein
MSPLAGCKSLSHLEIKSTNASPAAVAALQKALPNCKIEWDAASKPITNIDDPAFQQWVKVTQALPAEKQIEAVSKKLMELNPGFDGKVTGWDVKGPPVIQNGVVVLFGICPDHVTDISPVRALTGLKKFHCDGTYGKGHDDDRLSDLSPLREMKLEMLALSDTNVSDLSPLRGKPLTALYCYNTSVSDLSPLAESMSLGRLTVTRTKVTPAAVAALQKALPNCKIEWDDPAKK